MQKQKLFKLNGLKLCCKEEWSKKGSQPCETDIPRENVSWELFLLKEVQQAVESWSGLMFSHSCSDLALFFVE